MLNENPDAGHAGGRVSYESPSQFSREYSRLFGAPPQRDSASSADQLPQMLAAFRMFGHLALIPVPDLDRTDYFLIVGANPRCRTAVS